VTIIAVLAQVCIIPRRISGGRYEVVSTKKSPHMKPAQPYQLPPKQGPSFRLFETVSVCSLSRNAPVTNSEGMGRQRLQIVLSRQILDEYQRVAQTLAAKDKTIDIVPIIDLVTIHGQFVDTSGTNIAVCEDLDDDKFIECAVAGRCDTIVSGDRHLLKLSVYEGIANPSPRYFVDKYL
jgi:uncharacterized protein